MSIKVSDHVFLHSAKPVVVADIDKDERIHVSDSGEAFDQIKTIGFKNGLAPADKSQLTAILAEVTSEQDPLKKIALLDEQIKTLKSQRGNNAESKLERYLTAEKAFIMNAHRVSPRTYTVSRLQIKV